jgi:hypothetical protein
MSSSDVEAEMRRRDDCIEKSDGDSGERRREKGNGAEAGQFCRARCSESSGAKQQTGWPKGVPV